MDFLQPTSLDEALAAKRAVPGAVAIAGGTDVMVDINFGRRRPEALLDLSRVEELRGWSRRNGSVRVGAGVTYAQVLEHLRAEAPALAAASRTVGSPQIRSRGTVGGNLGSASPAGDAIPPLLAADASVEVASSSGARMVPVRQFFTGPKRNVLAPDELIVSVEFPAADGPQHFSKVGPRNAMVIAVASFAVSLWPATRRVGTGLGSVAPTPVGATEAERFIEGELSSAGFWETGAGPGAAAVHRFGALVAEAASPIDDVRGSAAYRRRALAVVASRALAWALDDHIGN